MVMKRAATGWPGCENTFGHRVPNFTHKVVGRRNICSVAWWRYFLADSRIVLGHRVA